MLSTLPNILTLSRILAVPLLVILLWDATWVGYTAAFVLFSVAAATDYLDGYLARSQGTVSKLGVFLDPVADKIMVAATIVMLVHTGQIHGWTVIPALIILLREITVSGLREYLAGLSVSLPVSALAKWKTGVPDGRAGAAHPRRGDAGAGAVAARTPDRRRLSVDRRGAHCDHRL